MKCSVEIKPDKEGYYKRQEILFLMKQRGYCVGPINEAIENHDIPQRRSSDKKKARAKLRLEDVMAWAKKHCHIN